MEVAQHANSWPYEGCGGRKAFRNRYMPLTLITVNGRLNINKPQLRGLSLETGVVFDRYSRVEKALQLEVVESYLQGVSTRTLTDITKKLSPAMILTELKGMAKAIDLFDRFQDSLHSYSAFPKQQGRRLWISNMLERANLELRRITRKIGALLSDRSLLRLAVAMVMNTDEEWQTGRRYLNMEAMS